MYWLWQTIIMSSEQLYHESLLSFWELHLCSTKMVRGASKDLGLANQVQVWLLVVWQSPVIDRYWGWQTLFGRALYISSLITDSTSERNLNTKVCIQYYYQCNVKSIWLYKSITMIIDIKVILVQCNGLRPTA